jgi:hypothetical protein
MPPIISDVTAELYIEARAPLTIDAVERASPVFLTSGAGGVATISFVSVGRLEGALMGLEEVKGLVLSVLGCVAGALIGWLDTVLTTLSRSCARVAVAANNRENERQTDRYEIFFKKFKTYSS